MVRKEMEFMKILEFNHLLKYCKTHNLDPFLIDSEIDYYENLEYLKSLPSTQPKPEEIYDKSECEAVEVKNDKLEWNEFVAKWLDEHPVEEKEANQTYKELCQEVGYPKKEILNDAYDSELSDLERIFLSNITYKRLPEEEPEPKIFEVRLSKRPNKRLDIRLPKVLSKKRIRELFKECLV